MYSHAYYATINAEWFRRSGGGGSGKAAASDAPVVISNPQPAFARAVLCTALLQYSCELRHQHIYETRCGEDFETYFLKLHFSCLDVTELEAYSEGESAVDPTDPAHFWRINRVTDMRQGIVELDEQYIGATLSGGTNDEVALMNALSKARTIIEQMLQSIVYVLAARIQPALLAAVRCASIEDARCHADTVFAVLDKCLCVAKQELPTRDFRHLLEHVWTHCCAVLLEALYSLHPDLAENSMLASLDAKVPLNRRVAADVKCAECARAVVDDIFQYAHADGDGVRKARLQENSQYTLLVTLMDMYTMPTAELLAQLGNMSVAEANSDVAVNDTLASRLMRRVLYTKGGPAAPP